MTFEEMVSPRRTPGTPEMVHPLQDESFKILSGSLNFRIGGQEQHLKAGESLVIPKGTPHNWWNESDEEAHALEELRPALRTEEYSRISMGSVVRRSPPQPAADGGLDQRALAATIPCGFVDGLPVGLQIVGRPNQEAAVLRASRAFEQLQPWVHPKEVDRAA